MIEKQQALFAQPSSSTKPITQQKKTTSFPISWKIFIDGAARGNPGKAGAGIYILDEHHKPLVKEGFFLGEKTNNQAEYLALALAIGFLIELTKHKTNDIVFTFVSDSLLLVKQMKGEYKVKNPILADIKQVLTKLLAQYKVSFNHVLREKNTIADKLANDGVDRKRKLPDFLQRFVQDNRLLPIP